MTITTQVNRAVFTGNGSTTAFDFTFKALAASDLIVSVWTDGVESVKTITTHYTVSLLTEGGTVAFLTAPASGTTVVIQRSMAYTQPTDYENQGSFYPATHGRSYDRATMQIQQLKDLIERSIVLPASTPVAFSNALPASAANRYLVVNSDNDGFTFSDESPVADPTLRQDLIATSGSSLVKHLPSGTGGVARTAQAIFRERISGADYGMVGDGSTDNTTAFNNAVAAAIAANDSLYIPPGNYRFTSRPAAITSAVRIYGDSMSTTVLERNYNEATNTNGFITIQGLGVSLQGMSINAVSGTTGGAMVSIVSTSSLAVSFPVLEDLAISTYGTNTHVYTLYIDGSAKTSAPIGVRDIALRNVHAFGASTKSVYIKGAVGLTWFGGGIYQAGGTDGGLTVTGDATVNSFYVNTDLTNLSGKLILSHLQYGDIKSTVIGSDIENATSVLYTKVRGYVTGTAQNNWLSSGIDRPQKLFYTGTYDPASLNDGQRAETDVTVTGAALGDFAEASFSLDTQGIILDAQVTATNTVTVTFHNETGGTIDLGSGTLRVQVEKPQA